MSRSRPVASNADLVVAGGRNFYGVTLGILMLDVRVPRIPGDVGNATTWPWPVLFRVIPGAGVKRAIRELGKRELLEPFLAGARELDAAGVSVITTSCGYCALFQRELQEAASATVISSALLQLPWLASLLPPRERIGILTMEAASLTHEHLAAAGAPEGLPVAIVGMEETSGYTHRHYLERRRGDGRHPDAQGRRGRSPDAGRAPPRRRRHRLRMHQLPALRLCGRRGHGAAGLRPDHGRRLGCRGAPEAALSGPALKVAAKAAAKAAPVTEQMSIIEAIRRGPP